MSKTTIFLVSLLLLSMASPIAANPFDRILSILDDDFTDVELRLIACEEYPWGEATNVNHIRRYYRNVRFREISLENDGKIYPMVCGIFAGNTIKATVPSSQVDKISSEGWIVKTGGQITSITVVEGGVCKVEDCRYGGIKPEFAYPAIMGAGCTEELVIRDGKNYVYKPNAWCNPQTLKIEFICVLEEITPRPLPPHLWADIKCKTEDKPPPLECPAIYLDGTLIGNSTSGWVERESITTCNTFTGEWIQTCILKSDTEIPLHRGDPEPIFPQQTPQGCNPNEMPNRREICCTEDAKLLPDGSAVGRVGVIRCNPQTSQWETHCPFEDELLPEDRRSILANQVGQIIKETPITERGQVISQLAIEYSLGTEAFLQAQERAQQRNRIAKALIGLPQEELRTMERTVQENEDIITQIQYLIEEDPQTRVQYEEIIRDLEIENANARRNLEQARRQTGILFFWRRWI